MCEVRTQATTESEDLMQCGVSKVSNLLDSQPGNSRSLKRGVGALRQERSACEKLDLQVVPNGTFLIAHSIL